MIRLARAQRGVAATEFALALPVLLLLGAGGIELVHYATARLSLSHVALTLSDNASRTGSTTQLSSGTVDEQDINDILDGAVAQAGALDLKGKGRIILSSLEVNPDGGQWIHWQRCYGDRTDFPSHYGAAGDGASGTGLAGIGTGGSQIQAVPGSAVMFVELQYQYQPVFSMLASLFGDSVVRYTAAYTVREDRDLTQITNKSGETVRNCTS